MRTKSSCPEPREMHEGISRRALFVAAAVPLLAGCSSDPNSDTAALTHMLGHSLDLFTGGSSITLADVEKVPFASLGVRVGSDPQTMLLLATRTGPTTVWTSAVHIALAIQYGRIIRTAGLPSNLSATTFPQPDPLASGLQNLRGPATAKRSVDFADRNAYGNVIDYTIAPTGTEEIEILGTRIKTVHAVEHGSCASLSWTFTNEYWADTMAGRVWRSTQYVHPDLAAVEVELFRPPKV